jgi:hypothetical protein
MVSAKKDLSLAINRFTLVNNFRNYPCASISLIVLPHEEFSNRIDFDEV